jgi:hypothetical protein
MLYIPLAPLTKQNAHLMIHHCIGPEPDHGVYRGMSEPVRAASTFINDPAVAAEEIDVPPVRALMVASYYHVRFEVETCLYLPSYGYGCGKSRCEKT